MVSRIRELARVDTVKRDPELNFHGLRFAKSSHVIEAQQFSREWLEDDFFPLAEEMENIFLGHGNEILKGKRMVTFFYEPSTRTRASFEFAMDLLGGRVIFSTENAKDFSSAVKGEDIEDTMRVLSRYRPDVIILRSSKEGDARLAAEYSSVPIINGGDGEGQHPTQSLGDLLTIKRRIGRIDGIRIAMVGDLLRGRTVRSLAYLLGKFRNVKIYFVSPEPLKIRGDIKDYLKRHNVEFQELDDLREVAAEVDAIYQTRSQKERGTNPYHLISDNGYFLVHRPILEIMKPSAIIMHPLPRNDEIAKEVDDDPRAVYLSEQILNGLFSRMALLQMLLS